MSEANTIPHVAFDLDGLNTFRANVAAIIQSGVVEHTSDTLSAMRNAYEPSDTEGQQEVTALEQRMGDCSAMMPRIHTETLASVLSVVRMSGVQSVVDLGCGEGLLTAAMARELAIEKVHAIELSERQFKAAKAIVAMLDEPEHSKVTLHQLDILKANMSTFRALGALTLVEVVEHVDDRAWIENVLGMGIPLVVATTPNADFNALYGQHRLQPNGMRHPDHRFELGRRECIDWAQTHAERAGYDATLLPIGPADVTHGSATLMVVFQKTRTEVGA
jgi:2-polyprenyl-3-methyl-5-hydroxy-6-metoxy-1,4-benzoquinol methylase